MALDRFTWSRLLTCAWGGGEGRELTGVEGQGSRVMWVQDPETVSL